MAIRILITLISSILFFVLLFFVWHFFLSIYEVKYKYDFEPENIKTNTEYFITCVAVNSFGWEMSFRNLNFSVTVETGNEIIELGSADSNNTKVFMLLRAGTTVLQLDSDYSLNPTKITLTSAN